MEDARVSWYVAGLAVLPNFFSALVVVVGIEVFNGERYATVSA